LLTSKQKGRLYPQSSENGGECSPKVTVQIQ